MKILFFIESLRAGGKERRILELMKGLRQIPDLQLELVITRAEVHYHEFHDLHIPLHVIERKLIKKDPRLFWKFYALARKIKPDIIHVWGNMVAVYAVPAAWRLKIPMLNSQITDATPGQRPLGKDLAFRYSARIIANTHAGLEAYHAPRDKSGVIHNGFNFVRLSHLRGTDDVRKQFNITTRYTVGMVATISPYKDYATFLRGAQRVLEHRSDISFLCVGEGDPTALRSLIAARNSHHIVFTGKQSGVESIMNVCDIGVLMTDVKYHAEGISNALVEFMALGKPVIATRSGGSAELVTEDTGFLIDPYSDEQLADRIIQLLNDDPLRQHLGLNGRARIENDFSIARMVNSFYNEYLKLMPSSQHAFQD